MAHLHSRIAYALAALILVNAGSAHAVRVRHTTQERSAKETSQAFERFQAFLRLPPMPTVEKVGISLGLDRRDKPNHWDGPDETGKFEMSWVTRRKGNTITMAYFAYVDHETLMEVSFSRRSCVTIDKLISHFGAKKDYATSGGGDLIVQQFQGLEFKQADSKRIIYLDHFQNDPATSWALFTSDRCIGRLEIAADASALFSDQPK